MRKVDQILRISMDLKFLREQLNIHINKIKIREIRCLDKDNKFNQ